MGNWSTLNKGVTASTKDAIEIQVERLLETYQETLKCHQKGQLELAKEKYQQLVSHALVKKEPKPKKKTGTNVDLVEESPLSTLRFLVFKNYASILEQEFATDPTNTAIAREALEHYLQVVKIDPTEYTLWYHIGYLSHTLKKLRFARIAYETGFYLDSNERILKLHILQPSEAIKIIKGRRFTPMQWKCFEGLCNVLYDIGDYYTCKNYIDIIMAQIQNWDLGLELLKKIEGKDKMEVTEDLNNDDMDVIMNNIDVPGFVPVTLEKPDWSLLIKSLFKEYKRLVVNTSKDSEKNDNDEEGLSNGNNDNRLTSTTFVNQSIRIMVNIEEEEIEKPVETTDEKEDRELEISKDGSLDETLPDPMEIGSAIITSPSTSEFPAATRVEPLSKITNESIQLNDTPIVTEDDGNVQMTETDQQPSLKRKREDEESEAEPTKENNDINSKEKNDGNNSENSGDSENDEEDEAEEKRLSLRASKRQREKIANEESSRLKMLEEENQFTEKMQNFYDNVKSLPKLHRPVPWYAKKAGNNLSMLNFWEWFDNKVSELDSGYCWDIDTTASSNLFGDNRGKNLTLFSKSINATKESNNLTSSIAVKEFINELNSSNSGITDSLCKLLQAIIKDDQINEQDSDAVIMDNELLDLITDTVTTLEFIFVDDILSNQIVSDTENISVMLRVCEYLMDRLIRGTMAIAEESSIHTTVGSHGRRRVSTSLVKSSKLKVIDALVEQCQYWLGLLERIMFTSSLNTFFSDVNGSQEPVAISLDNYKLQLRYWVLKGKLAQCTDDIENSYSWYTKCQTLLKFSNKELHQGISINLKSMYDSVIDADSIENKLNLLQVGKLFATSKQKLDAEDYEGVITDLEPTIKLKLDSGKLAESNEIIHMINMLATAYVKVDRNLDAWNCYMRMFCCIMQQLVTYGENHTGENLPYLNKNEDTQFFKLLSLINSLTDNMISLIQENKSENWLPHDFNEDLADNLVILLRMSIYYNFRHSDYVPFVNNFTNPEVPIHRPSKVTKSNGFNSILIKAWVLQSHLFQHIICNNEDPVEGEILLNWAKLLHDLHDDLGEREMCGAANGIFLNHLLKTLAKVDDVFFRKEIYQCYHCIYGVHLATESDLIEEHHCIHRNLDQKSSEPLFALVVNSCIEKLERGSLLKVDLKDAIEAITDLFEELPTTNLFVKSNADIIETYLNSDLELHPSIDSVLRTAIIPTVNINAEKTGTSLVYYRMFWIRGKTLRIQNKNRARISSEKTKADLKKATEEFTFHLVLNPDDADGWCELGTCFQQLAEEELNWSASNIQSNRKLIGKYQRKACHAFLRSLYLANSEVTKELAKNELFTNFGNLIYSIASAPMNMEALKSQSAKHSLGKDGTLSLKQSMPPLTKSAYKLAVILYNRALHFQIQDKLEWRCYYMTGKCLAKIRRPPREVVDWYLQAIRRTKTKNGKPEQQFEPIYIFCSYLVKYLYNGKLEAKDVIELLENEKALHKSPNTEEEADQEVMILGSSSDIKNAGKSSAVLQELLSQLSHLPIETANAYNLVFQRLSEIRGVDSKNWQHRAIYRMSWMYYHIYHNVEKAKAELMKLFNLRVITKTYIAIWKQGFELPGKHYEYISKYTLFLIDLAKESNDTQTLKHLYRKLRRAQNMVLDDKKVYHKAYASYLETVRAALRNVHQAKVYMKMIKESKIEKSQFEALCSASSVVTQNVEPELYTILQDLSELKRLTQGFVTVTDADEELDKAIRMCYAAVVFGGESNEAKRKELDTAIPTDGNETIESKSRKDLRAVLLAQAKIYMQSIPPSK